MIELLVVIGIVAVLLGIGFFAYSKVIASSRLKATTTTLGNLKGMLAELEAAQGGTLKNQPRAWLWWDGSNAINPVSVAAGAYAPDFWKDPYHIGNQAIPPAGAGTFDALAAPSSVTEDSIHGMNQRFGSIAIVNTNLAMSQLNAPPANKSRFGALPRDTTVVPRWVSGEIPNAGNDRFIGFTPDGTNTLGYVAGVHVQNGSSRWVATSSLAPGANGTPSTPNWADESAAPTGAPLLLDGWGNPIIFVPATGLRVRLLNGKSDYDPADPAQNFIIISPEGRVQTYSAALTGSPFVLSPGKPFFASAGPDGDFSKGDDNVYSFEQ